MYLAAFYVAFDVDPELTSFDRQRLLRSLKEKLKQKFHHRIAVSGDEEEMAICASFFDDCFDRLKTRAEAIQESVESAGEARIRFCQLQTYLWFDGQFMETDSEVLLDADKAGSRHSSHQKFPHSAHAKEKMIVYADAEEEEMVPIPSRFSRKNFRIPTRK